MSGQAKVLAAIWITWILLSGLVLLHEPIRTTKAVEGFARHAECIESRSVRGIKLTLLSQAHGVDPEYFVPLSPEQACEEIIDTGTEVQPLVLELAGNRVVSLTLNGVTVSALRASNETGQSLLFLIIVAALASAGVFSYFRNVSQRRS